MQLDVGVVDGVVHLPTCRAPGPRGRVAAAAFDEDVTTLAATAVLELLDRNPTSRPAALLLATTSAPLVEGGTAQVVAEIAGLAGELHVAELGGTTAAGLAAVVQGAALVAAGGGPVLVVAADVRRDGRGRPLGDGAVALLLAEDGAVGRVRPAGARAELLRDHWRPDGATGLASGDRSLLAARRPWQDPPWDADATHDVVVADPSGPPLEGAGALGCAAPLVAALVSLATAEEGATVVAAADAGGVAHAVAVLAGPAGAAAGARAAAVLAGGEERTAPVLKEVEGFAPFTSGPRAWRERGQDLRLEAQRDPATGEVLFPPVPERAARGFERIRLPRRGRVLTHTRDHVFPYGGPIQMVVVDLAGGGRFFGQAVPESGDLAIDADVVLVPRRLYAVDGLPQYYWKVRAADAVDRAQAPAQQEA